MTAEVAARVQRAAGRLLGLVVETPLVASPWLSARSGAEVRLKLENVQHTGSFKFRGATNALAELPAAARAAGVVAASSGNHGLGVAAAAAALAVPALVFVPETTAAGKQAAIRALGAEVRTFGRDCLETERHARAFAARTGRPYVSPYNDLTVVAGQGTVAVELLAQWPALETVYVALGGGGLTGGMAAFLKHERPGIEVVACSPRASPAMAECVRAGAIVDVPCAETLSDSTAGGVEPGAVTFPLCRDLVDRFVDVEEAAIRAALLGCLEHQHLLVEGAAAVAIAGCLQDAPPAGRRAAIVVCGGNLPLERLRALLC
ncbi:MAG: threonine/serine dehydratase [Planctomycetes bacterium]|nr:threonine/serine dehydratase [Planctomycetota bacterium]